MASPSALPRIQSLAPYVPGMSIAGIQEKYGLDNIIKMASNENPLGCSPLAREAIQRDAASAFRYPQGGNPRLVAALSRFHNVEAANIVVGNGSDEIIDLLFRMFTQSGIHNIVCFEPCFSLYPIQAQINGIETRRQPLAKNFTFNFDALLARVDKNTRLVFITAPDNPSGYCPPLAAVEGLAAALAEKAPEALLVIDEAYMDFADREKDFSLLANHILPPNTVFLRTFSKSFGLAGLRIGYGVFPASLAECYWRARLPFSVNIIAETAALAALEDEAFRTATLQTVKSGRAMLAAGLARLGCHVWPSSANFLLFQLPPNTISAHAAFEALLQSGIIIRALDSYGLPDHLRVSVGNTEENKKFLLALAQILNAGGSR